jgi:hypothetical protein
VTRSAPFRGLWFIAICVALFLFGSCQKKQSPPQEEVLPPLERAAPATPVGTTQTILQKTFSLATSKPFPFSIPPHAASPHLHGIFESYVRDLRGASDDAANIDFLVLNEDQYDEFSHGRPSEALFSVEASHNQAINFDLPASLEQPVKYYLVFRSSPHSDPKKVVEANFRIDF